MLGSYWIRPGKGQRRATFGDTRADAGLAGHRAEGFCLLRPRVNESNGLITTTAKLPAIQCRNDEHR